MLIQEFVIGSVDSERGMRALSKVNWLHRRYSSKIGNSEMIHTLAMFVLEPQRWIERYEWRPMAELEKVAAFIYWKEVGNRMGIKDIPQTLEALKTWVDDLRMSIWYMLIAIEFARRQRSTYIFEISLGF